MFISKEDFDLVLPREMRLSHFINEGWHTSRSGSAYRDMPDPTGGGGLRIVIFSRWNPDRQRDEYKWTWHPGKGIEPFWSKPFVTEEEAKIEIFNEFDEVFNGRQ